MAQNKAGVFDKLLNVIIRVKDITVLKEWYEQVLELKPVYSDDNEKMAVYETGTDVNLTVWQLKPGEALSPACLNGSFPVFYSNNINRAHVLLKERNVIVEDIHGSEFFKYFGFFDPEGNRMEVCQVFSVERFFYMETTDNKIIDGKKISEAIIEEVRREVVSSGIQPGIALILVGNNPASEIYVRNKGKTCESLGFYSIIEQRPETCPEQELLAMIDKYNNDDKIHGILVQLPLPKHINEMKVIEAVNYKKDVDGFHPINAGRLMIGERCFIPCTPAGIIELIKRYNIETAGKNIVVIGRSNIVGKPIGNLLLQKNKNANATVTFCHSYTKDISSHTKNADIIIAAIGKAFFLKADMIKDGCVIIDVGINKIADSTKKSGQRTVGDVDFNDCYPKVSMITPVPKGVGPMTIAMLMKNTLDSATKKVYS